MRACITDDCPADGVELPNWFHVCPVCGYTTIDLEEIKRSMAEPGIKIALVDWDDLTAIVNILENETGYFKFAEELKKKYLE